ncbi:tetratricopeptide repeat protein [Simiduia litorea]|uniref:tetratricopeptide repeat protein n=1 Tax=Simiduia litorea TaxID=1435348 RepID=UPI0036F312A6
MLHTAKWFVFTSLLTLIACSGGEKKTAEDAERHFKSAVVYQKQGQLRAAMLEARNVIQLTPESPRGYGVLADIYNQIGAFGLTIKLLEGKSLTSPALDTYLAQAYLASKKYRSALSLLESPANTTFPTDLALERKQLLGETYLYLKEKEKFDALLNGLAADDAGRNVYLYLLSAADLSAEKVDKAQAQLNELVGRDPQAFDALTLLGDIAIYKNDLDASEAFYTKALGTLTNTDVFLADRTFVLRRLIEVLSRQGRSAEAFAYQKLLSDANPGSYAAQQKFSDAMELYIDGDLDAASRLLKELREQYPQDKNSATLLGVVSQKQGDNELAAELFDEYLDAETVTPSVIQAAAIAKLNTQKADEAVQMLEAAVESQPDNAGILATYGLALVELNRDSNEASMMLERSLAIDSSQHRLRLALARSYMERGKQEQALAQLKKAYTDQPQDFLVQQSYFRTLAALGQKDVLKQEIDGFNKQNADSPKGIFFAGWHDLSEKKYAESIKAFERVITSQNPEVSGLAYAGLAQAYEASGNLVKATQAWADVIKHNPASLRAYGQWLTSLKKRGQVDRAIEQLAAMALPEGHWQPDYVKARITLDQGDLPQALLLAQGALTKQPEQPIIQAFTAELYQQQAFDFYKNADQANAKRALMKALELQPENVTYVANLIKIEMDGGNNEEAQKILDSFGSAKSDLNSRHYLQGKIYERSGDLVAALVSYRASWEQAPSDLTGDAIFNALRNDKARPTASIDFLEDWVRAMPRSTKPLLYKAMAAQASGDKANAEKLYSSALDLAPDIPAALNNLAWLYFENGDQRALPTAKRAYDLAPTSAPIMDTYGWLLVQSGDVKTGHAILVRASAQAPSNTEISEHLAAAKALL